MKVSYRKRRNPFVDQVYRFSLTPMICYFPMLDGLIRDLS